MLEIAENGRTWILSGPASSYALHLTAEDELLHLHWGPRIALADAEALAVSPLPDYRPFEAPSTDARSTPSRAAPASHVRPCPCAPTSGAAPSGASRRTTPRATSCGCGSATAD